MSEITSVRNSLDNAPVSIPSSPKNFMRRTCLGDTLSVALCQSFNVLSNCAFLLITINTESLPSEITFSRNGNYLTFICKCCPTLFGNLCLLFVKFNFKFMLQRQSFSSFLIWSSSALFTLFLWRFEAIYYIIHITAKFISDKRDCEQ